MEYQEAIKNHINECRHRADVIRNPEVRLMR